MKEFKKPDLNAPRFRPKKTNILNSNFLKSFIEANPKYKDISLDDIKSIVRTFNGKIWDNVIEVRDGIELPEQLGNIFIASTKKRKGIIIDYNKSAELGYVVNHKNWDTDGLLGKICYTNIESKYKFSFHQ